MGVEFTVLSMVREVVFGLDGVLYSMPMSDVLTFILAALLLHRTYGQLKID